MKAEVKYLAIVAVGNTRSECEAALKAAYAKGAPSEYSVVIDAFFRAPALESDSHDCVVVRRGALMRAFVAAVQATQW